MRFAQGILAQRERGLTLYAPCGDLPQQWLPDPCRHRRRSCTIAPDFRSIPNLLRFGRFQLALMVEVAIALGDPLSCRVALEIISEPCVNAALVIYLIGLLA